MSEKPIIQPQLPTEPIYGAKGASGPPRRAWATLSTEEKRKALTYYTNLVLWFIKKNGINHLSDEEIEKDYKQEEAQPLTEAQQADITIEIYRLSLWINNEE